MLELPGTGGVMSLLFQYGRCLVGRKFILFDFNLAFCDSFNQKMKFITFLISNYIFMTFHYNWISFPFNDKIILKPFLNRYLLKV